MELATRGRRDRLVLGLPACERELGTNVLAGVRTCASPKAGDTCRVKISNDVSVSVGGSARGWKGIERLEGVQGSGKG